MVSGIGGAFSTQGTSLATAAYLNKLTDQLKPLNLGADIIGNVKSVNGAISNAIKSGFDVKSMSDLRANFLQLVTALDKDHPDLVMELMDALRADSRTDSGRLFSPEDRSALERRELDSGAAGAASQLTRFVFHVSATNGAESESESDEVGAVTSEENLAPSPVLSVSRTRHVTNVEEIPEEIIAAAQEGNLSAILQLGRLSADVDDSEALMAAANRIDVARAKLDAAHGTSGQPVDENVALAAAMGNLSAILGIRAILTSNEDSETKTVGVAAVSLSRGLSNFIQEISRTSGSNKAHSGKSGKSKEDIQKIIDELKSKIMDGVDATEVADIAQLMGEIPGLMTDFPGLFEVVKRAIRQCLQDEALSLGPDEAKQVISYINDLFEEVIGEPLLNDNETNTLLDQIAQLNWDADPENPDGLRGIASDQDTLVRTDSDPEFGFGVGVDGLENAEAASASGGIRVKALDVSSFFASGVAALSGGNRVERGQSASGDTSQDRNEQQRKVEKVVRILEKLAEEGIDRALQGVGDKLNKVGLGDLLSRSSGSSVDSELF